MRQQPMLMRRSRVDSLGNLRRRAIPRVWVIPPRLLRHPQIILPQLPDVAVVHRPARGRVEIQLLRLEQDVAQVVAHLPQAVRQTLAFHQRQRAGDDGRHGAEHGDGDVAVDLGQAAQDDEDGAEEDLEDQEEVGEDVEEAVLEIDVAQAALDRAVQASGRGEVLREVVGPVLGRGSEAHEFEEVGVG